MTTSLSPKAKLSAVKAAIIKAVPEIMELKAGCYISGRGLSNGFVFNRRVPGPDDTLHAERGGYTTDDISMRDIGKYTIHGREIRLNDLCHAIREVGTSDMHDCPDGGRNVASILLDLWDPRYDDLDRQGEELVSFAHSLLCP